MPLFVGFVVLLVWGIGAGIWAEKRIVGWYAARGRDEPGRTALLVVGTHVASWVVWLLVAVVGTALADVGGSNAWAGWVVVPWLLVYLPWMLQFLPGERSGHRVARRDAEDRGMSRGTARAMFWTGTPFALVGMAIAVSSLFATYAA